MKYSDIRNIFQLIILSTSVFYDGLRMIFRLTERFSRNNIYYIVQIRMLT